MFVNEQLAGTLAPPGFSLIAIVLRGGVGQSWRRESC